MKTITDDQIAEIEALAKAACEYTQTDWFSPSDLSESLADEDARFVGAAGPFTVRALITRLREAERWKADASQVLNPLFDYAHSLGLAKLGHSVTEALIEDHKRLREAERDAARYRWIREVASGEYEDFDVVAGAAFDAAYGRARNFDLSIDEAMLSARVAAE